MPPGGQKGWNGGGENSVVEGGRDGKLKPSLGGVGNEGGDNPDLKEESRASGGVW